MPDPHIVLCNELGEGRGHFVNLVPIGKRLRGSGLRVTYLATDPAHALAFGVEPRHVVEVPRAASPVAVGSAVTFGDSVAKGIYGDDARATEQIAAWSRALDEVGPDLVIADYSPSALLAGRGRCPRFAVGNGFTLPPSDMPFYPRLWHAGPGPAHDERRMVERINASLKQLGIEPLAQFPEIMAAERQFVFSVPLLDPYDGIRKEHLLGSIEHLPLPRSGADRNQVFAYFRDSWAQDSRLLDALSKVSGGCFILPGTDEVQRTAASRAGARVTDMIQPIGDILAGARLLVHYGGATLVMNALLAGIPQVILATDIEKHLNGMRLSARGAARVLDWRSFTAIELGYAIEQSREDPTMAEAARAIAAENARYAAGEGIEDPIRAVADFFS